MSLGVGRRWLAAALSMAVGLSGLSPGSPSPSPQRAAAAAATDRADDTGSCLRDAEPNDRLEDVQVALMEGQPATQGAFCLLGTLTGADQDILVWEVTSADAGHAWTLSLAGVPRALTAFQLKPITSEPGADSLLTGGALLDLSVGPDAIEPTVLSELFVAAGRYVFGLTAGGQPPGPDEAMTYRLDIRQQPTTTPAGDVEPNDDDASASAVRGAFAVSGDGEGSPDVFRWTLGDEDAARTWTLGSRTRLDDTATLVLADAEGSALVRASSREGRIDLPDLTLAVGEYLVRLESAASGRSPYVLSATASDVPSADPEPNDDASSAVQMDRTRPIARGRLAREQDEDWYAFSVAGAAEGATLDIRLLWKSDVDRELCLRGPGGEEIQCRSSSNGLVLPGLSLPAGEYRLQVRGRPEPDDVYLVRVDPGGPGAPDFEREPNDGASSATPFDASLGMRGRASPDDTDHFAILVQGDPQVWQLDASGSGIGSLDWIKADGTRLASGAIAADRSTAVLTDMYLIPGEHWIRLEGGDGEYTLRMTSLGPIDPDAEREPNDRTADAERLRVGSPRSGRLPTEADEDGYRFVTRAPDHLIVSLTAPPDAALEMDISDDVSVSVRLHASEGQTITYDGLFPVGRYTIDLRAVRPGSGRYSIGLGRADPFDLLADQEPNDSPGDAHPLPSDIPVSAGVTGAGDVDWYAIDAPPDAGLPLVIAVDGDVATVELWDAGTQLPLVAHAEGSTYEAAEIPADADLRLMVLPRADYTVSVGSQRDLGPRASPAAEAAGLELGADVDVTPVAAHWPDGQVLRGSVTVSDAASSDGAVTLDAVASDRDWAVALERTALTLTPGATESVPFMVHVPPDASADEVVRLTLRARRADGTATTAFFEVTPSGEVSPSAPARHWLLPAALLGALDVGSLALGAVPVGSLHAEGEAHLHDGFAPSDWGLSWPIGSLPLELGLDLAGDEPVMVAGTIIHPLSADPSLGDSPQRFHLDVSLDGVAWETVLEGEVARAATEQAFVPDRPMPARHARLVVETTHRGGSSRIEFGEWKVLAVPGTMPSAEPLDIADLAAGGHVPRLEPQPSQVEVSERMLTSDLEQQRLPIEAGDGVRWVLGFMDDRVARIGTFEWQDPMPSDPSIRIGTVHLAVSSESAIGPWEDLASWDLQRGPDGSVAPLRLPEPVAARFVRFVAEVPGEAGTVELPGRLRVLEANPDGMERSIIGQWGSGNNAGPLEWSGDIPSMGTIADDPDDDSAQVPRPLDSGRLATGRVRHGEDSDWYALSIPAGRSSISLDLEGVPYQGAALRLTDSDGQPVPMRLEGGEGPRSVTYRGSVTPGDGYLLEVLQPPASIVFTFDTSASIGGSLDAVEGALRTFAEGVRSGREAVRILPFDDEPLFEGWVDEPFEIAAAVGSYVLDVSSSDVEASVLRASRELATREGARAILLVTDAASSSYPATSEMWQGIADVRPLIFAVEAGGLGEAPPTRRHHLMQDLATSTGGTYGYASTTEDIEHAFDRLATWLRRPAGYRVSFETSADELAPLEPGRLSVTAAPTDDGPRTFALGDEVAIELILDTSGSMRQRLGGRRRIDIAKSVLVELVTEVLPAGVPVALRVFKDEPRSCETELASALASLDPDALAARIGALRARRTVRTPLAAAIEQVKDDLREVTGRRMVVVVSDGRESCGGDPAAAVDGLVAAGYDITINVVGLALDDRKLRRSMRGLAERGNGSYFNAVDPEHLRNAMGLAVSPPFEVLDAAGQVVERSTVGADAVTLAPGTYDIVVRSQPEVRFDDVLVVEATAVALELPVP